MPNMSYCRFQNTYRDLHDCTNALEELITNLQTCIEFYEKAISIV